MPRPILGAAVALVLCAGALPAQEGIQRGTIKKLDAEKGAVTIAAGGKEHEYTVTDDTRLFEATGKTVADRLKHFKEGQAVFFKPGRQDGKDVLVGMKAVQGGRPGPAGVERGTLKKADAEKGLVIIAADGKEHEYTITEDTRLPDAPGKTVAERLKRFKGGEAVFFKPERQDGKDVLWGMKLIEEGRPPAALPRADTSGLKPLPELGTGEYKGFPGGLYPEGKNERPAAHETVGVALAKEVRPLDADGKPAADGKVVLLSVGMSNTTQEFSRFKQLADGDADRGPRLVIVDGAQGGMSAARIVDPDEGTGRQFWTTVDRRLKEAGVTPAQVQAVWIKEADAGPRDPFPKHARMLQAELVQILHVLHDRYPNLKLAYLSSRIYAGYATTPLNPEPYAYESGFAVRWVIEQQLKGDTELNDDARRGRVRAPWVSWGPYLWANGTKKRGDGLTYERADFVGDGTHPSGSGQRKVAEQLLQFFKTDTTTKPWFLAP